MPKRLPRPDELIVEPEKIIDYLLCVSHPDGASKARFFSALGFEIEHWQVFADALMEHGRTRDLFKEVENPFGVKYVVQCLLTVPNARDVCIRSVWIAEGDRAPRLVTAYPA